MILLKINRQKFKIKSALDFDVVLMNKVVDMLKKRGAVIGKDIFKKDIFSCFNGHKMMLVMGFVKIF